MKHENQKSTRGWMGVQKFGRALAVACMSLVLVSACGFLSTPKTIHINQAVLQSAADKKWVDISKTMQENGLTTEQPVIKLIPAEQRVAAQFAASIDVGLMGLKLNGDMQMSGVPEYNSQLHAIVLRNFSVDSFEVKNLPPEAIGLTNRIIKQTVGRKVGVEVPIYFLKEDQLSFAGKNWIPEKIVVEPERLSVTLQPHDQ